MVSPQTLIQYLINLDLFGFFQALYVSAFVSSDMFYVALGLGITLPIYLRLKSFTILCILWFLFGTTFSVAFPAVSGMVVFMAMFGLAGIAFKTYFATRE